MRRGERVKKLLTAGLVAQGSAHTSTSSWYRAYTLLWTDSVQTAMQFVFIYTDKSSTVPSVIPAKGKASGTLECGAWSVCLVADGAKKFFTLCILYHSNFRRAVSVHDQRPVCPAAAVNKKSRSNEDHTSRIHYYKQRSSSVFLYPFSRPFHHYELRVHRHTTGLRRQYAFLGEHKSQRDNRASEDIIW